jgi:uncharacterized protein
MSSLLALILWLAFTFFAAAAIAPWAYLGLQQWLDFPFHRYVNRCLMISALVGLVFFWRHLGIRNAGDVLLPGAKPLRAFLVNFILGLLSMALVLGLTMLWGGRTWNGQAEMTFVYGVLAGALAVAVIEELLFRGVMQTVLTRSVGPWLGVGLTTVIFVAVHFIKVPSEYTPAQITWLSGWTAIQLSFQPLLNLSWWQPSGAILALVGLILSLTVIRTGTLSAAIGLHAGWIIAQRLSEALTQRPDNGEAMSASFNSHPLTALLLLSWFLGLCFSPRRAA